MDLKQVLSILLCFGGAGGQHACSVAASLGITHIIIHKFSSILSAYGRAVADVVQEIQEPISAEYLSLQAQLKKRFEKLASQSCDNLVRKVFKLEQIRHNLFLSMKYEGSDTVIIILKPEDS